MKYAVLIRQLDFETLDVGVCQKQLSESVGLMSCLSMSESCLEFPLKAFSVSILSEYFWVNVLLLSEYSQYCTSELSVSHASVSSFSCKCSSFFC